MGATMMERKGSDMREAKTATPPGSPEERRRLTDEEIDQETARLFGEISRQNRDEMKDELDTERVSSDVMKFRLR